MMGGAVLGVLVLCGSVAALPDPLEVPYCETQASAVVTGLQGTGASSSFAATNFTICYNAAGLKFSFAAAGEPSAARAEPVATCNAASLFDGAFVGLSIVTVSQPSAALQVAVAPSNARAIYTTDLTNAAAKPKTYLPRAPVSCAAQANELFGNRTPGFVCATQQAGELSNATGASCPTSVDVNATVLAATGRWSGTISVSWHLLSSGWSAGPPPSSSFRVNFFRSLAGGGTATAAWSVQPGAAAVLPAQLPGGTASDYGILALVAKPAPPELSVPPCASGGRATISAFSSIRGGGGSSSAADAFSAATNMQLCWTASHLQATYVCGGSPVPRNDKTTCNSRLWQQEVVEMFIAHEVGLAAPTSYLEFELAPTNVMYATQISKPLTNWNGNAYRFYPTDNASCTAAGLDGTGCPCADVRAGSGIATTAQVSASSVLDCARGSSANDCADVWAGTFSVPWATILRTRTAAEAGVSGGEAIRANFYRQVMLKNVSKCGAPGDCALGGWAPTFSGSFHEAAFFGVLRLEPPAEPGIGAAIGVTWALVACAVLAMGGRHVMDKRRSAQQKQQQGGRAAALSLEARHDEL